MSSKSGYRGKGKKSVPTTLGRAPPNMKADFIDLSHLRKPIDTSIYGLKQVLSLFETATVEVQRYITYECEIMFECRICRSVFRSLANFILHKRNYCSELFTPINRKNKGDFENNDLEVINKDSASSNEKISDTEEQPKRYPKRDLSNVLKKLTNKQECQTIADNVLNNELTEKDYLENHENATTNTISLEGIEGNNECVFQTAQSTLQEDLMKSEVMEIYSIFDGNEAILGSDGKIVDFKTVDSNSEKQKLICAVCNLKFATKKTLTHHIKYKHNATRMIYMCPDCKDTFANAWGVFRHLHKVHRKTTAQIRRMRDQIHASATKRKNSAKMKSTSSADAENDYENQESDLQCCSGCGKRFDRKAALHSHVQMCLKRIATSNLKEDQNADHEDETGNESSKRASRRKPEISRKIEKRNDLEGINESVKIVEESTEVCVIDKQSVPENTQNMDHTIYKKDLIQEVIFGSAEQNSIKNLTNSSEKYASPALDEEELVLGFSNGDVSSVNCESKNEETNADSTGHIINKIIDKLEVDASERLSETNIEDCINLDYGEDLKSEENAIVAHASTDSVSVLNINNNIKETKNDNIESEVVILDSDSESSKQATDVDPTHGIETQSTSSDINDESRLLCHENLCIFPLENDLCTRKTKDCMDVVDVNEINNTTPIQIDLASNVVVFAVDETSSTDSCSCFDDKSNDSVGSHKIGKNAANIEIKTSDETQNQENTFENIRKNVATHKTSSKKRKISDEADTNNESDIIFHQKCYKYVDWDDHACLPCSITFTTNNDLMKHMALHFNWLQYQCSKCDFMSYEKSACLHHDCIKAIDQEMIKYFIVPIPHWKTVQLATVFTSISNDQHLSDESDDTSKGNYSNLTCNMNKVNTQDPSVRKMIMEVIFGSQDTTNETQVSTVNNRPIRNRTSIKSVQKDFVYDMNVIDSKIKNTSSEHKVKPIKIVKNNETNFRIINPTSEDTCKKKRTC